MVQQISINWLIRFIRRPAFWLVVALLVFITFMHYREEIQTPVFLAELIAKLGLTRHAFERILYLAIIIWSGFLFEWKGSIAISLIALACMLPRAAIFSPTPQDALFETGAVFVLGSAVAFAFESLRKERGHRIQLAALNEIVSAVSQSLELGKVLNSSVDNIMNVMEVNAVLLFLLEEETSELSLAAHQGVSERFVNSVGRLKLGEGFNGMVAQTGAPAYVEDASTDPRLTKKAVIDEGIRSELIVPLKSKGKVMGTLCVCTHKRYEFTKDEVKTLTAIGNQIGVALENARLYEKEREFAEKLRMSEERYRQLFENAHDAIWINDIDGNIISANDAANRLVGSELKSLSHTSARSLLSKESLRLANEIRTKLLRGEAVVQPYEQKLVIGEGTVKILKLTTSMFRVDGKPVGFQHIARDVTQEMRMQENLRFYLEQVTKAQEDERMRIARELHDETIQQLVVLARELDIIASSRDGISKEKGQLLENLRLQVNSLMAGVRHLSQDLRPPTLDRLGLVATLEWLASNVENHSGIVVKVVKHGAERRLRTEAELLLFRITQEALNNVWRHSQATHAELLVEFEEGKTMITIRDNGKGFDLPYPTDSLTRHGKLGMVGMKERAGLLGGSLEFESKPGKGTIVTVEAPV
jgi:two-component system sensor histidine kinase DegS